MMRDRLIELLDIIIQPGEKTLGDIADHLLANGVIVPQVNVGDKLYYISGVGKIVENKVYYVGEYSRALCYTADGKPLLDNVFLDADANDSYYFTKEEAEKALAERSGE
jgi:hypothetical protein